MVYTKKVKIITGVIIGLMVVIILSIAYAAFSGTLTISGEAVGRKSAWDVHFANLSNITTSHTAKVLSEPQLTDSTTIEDYYVSLTSPGDSISFTFDVVNNGNYNAKITSIQFGNITCNSTDTTSASNMCNHIEYTLKYDSGATVAVNDVLSAKDTAKMKVTLTYDDTVLASELATQDVSISGLDITITYTQYGDAGVKENGEVADYTVYHQGDKITLNNEDYYVIANSGAGQDYVVALKDIPLTIAEVNLYGGVGTENNHVNKNVATNYSQGTATNKNGYGGMAYYSSETCGSVNGTMVRTGCITNYEYSEIKYIVDGWVQEEFINNELKMVNGYSARLITSNEYEAIPSTNSWRYNSQYWYWTMSKNGDYNHIVNIVFSNGNLNGSYGIYDSVAVVRPVINVYKSAIDTNNNNE